MGQVLDTRREMVTALPNTHYSGCCKKHKESKEQLKGSVQEPVNRFTTVLARFVCQYLHDSLSIYIEF